MSENPDGSGATLSDPPPLFQRIAGGTMNIKTVAESRFRQYAIDAACGREVDCDDLLRVTFLSGRSAEDFDHFVKLIQQRTEAKRQHDRVAVLDGAIAEMASIRNDARRECEKIVVFSEASINRARQTTDYLGKRLLELRAERNTAANASILLLRTAGKADEPAIRDASGAVVSHCNEEGRRRDKRREARASLLEWQKKLTAAEAAKPVDDRVADSCREQVKRFTEDLRAAGGSPDDGPDFDHLETLARLQRESAADRQKQLELAGNVARLQQRKLDDPTFIDWTREGENTNAASAAAG